MRRIKMRNRAILGIALALSVMSAATPQLLAQVGGNVKNEQASLATR